MERKQKSKCVQEELQTSVEKRATKWRGSTGAPSARKRTRVVVSTRLSNLARYVYFW